MKKLTTMEFVARARMVHGDQYDYSSTIYTSAHKNVSIECFVHGSFNQTPANHLSGKGCKSCGGTERLTRSQIVERFNEVHGDRYDYSRVEYTGLKTPVIIGCDYHGEFYQKPSEHMMGHGCRECARNKPYTTETFVAKAMLIHAGLYDYSDAQYTGYLMPVAISCPIHGEFHQTPGDHLAGCGCPSCGNHRTASSKFLSRSDFITRAACIHEGKYDYSGTIYDGCKTPVAITCPIHGVFWQTPDAHLAGKGCNRCTHRVSKSAKSWLDHMGIPDTPVHREVRGLIPNRRYIVDGFDPITNTVYEFHGDYWHGNPRLYDPAVINPSIGRLFGDLYEDTMIKRTEFEMMGYKYVEMWESEWITHQKQEVAA